MDRTICILSRTNLGLRVFEQALSDAGVNYRLVGGSGYWSQPEIRAVLCYLGCVSYPADWLIAGAIRAPFWPSKFLPKTALLAALKKEKDLNESSYWTSLVSNRGFLVEAKNFSALNEFVQFIHQLSRYRDLPPSQALKQILAALKAVEYYSVEEEHVDNDPLQNLAELIKISERFRTIPDFLDYARKVTAASKSRKGVALSTIHSFKGAEADVVYVVGVSDGVLPHAKATDLDEERNIWFTACSRPRTRLIITYSGTASPFLKDCGIMPVKESE
jgi:DNA helicase-2/ATP-dependent DNA helicase PcrA